MAQRGFTFCSNAPTGRKGGDESGQIGKDSHHEQVCITTGFGYIPTKWKG